TRLQGNETPPSPDSYHVKTIKNFGHVDDSLHQKIGGSVWILDVRLFKSDKLISRSRNGILFGTQFAVQIMLPRHVIAWINLIGQCELRFHIFKNIRVQFLLEKLLLGMLHQFLLSAGKQI